MGSVAAKPKSDQREIDRLLEPIVVNRASRGSRWPLRVVLLNARGGVRLNRIAQCLTRDPLNRASIILLCESDWRTDRTGGLETAAELAALLNMSFAYGPEFAIRGTGGEIDAFLGNAILSAEPFENVRAVAMPSVERRTRGYAHKLRSGRPAGLITRAKFGGDTITIGVAHPSSRSSPAGRERQMATYLAEFPPDGPAVFGGDLNTTTTELKNLRAIALTALHIAVNPARYRSPQSYEPLFERIAERGLEIQGANVMDCPTFTFSRLVPTRMRPKLDWLATRGVKPVAGSAAVVPARASLFSPRASDHDFVLVDIER